MALSDGAGDNKLLLRIIERNGSAHSCPSNEVLESERQAISAIVRRKISGTYGSSCKIIFAMITTAVLILTDILDLSPHHNCKEALNYGLNTSGVYLVQPDDYAPFEVRCV